MIIAGTVLAVNKGDPHESVNVEWDVDGAPLFAPSSSCTSHFFSGTVDVISPWELQLEEQAVYKYANVPRGSTRTLSFMFTTSWLPSRVSGAFAHSSVAVLFGVVTNGEAIAAAANEANGQRITNVLHSANHRQPSRLSLKIIFSPFFMLARRTTLHLYPSACGLMSCANWAST